MSSNETKLDEQGFEQGSPKMLAAEECTVQEKTDPGIQPKETTKQDNQAKRTMLTNRAGSSNVTKMDKTSYMQDFEQGSPAKADNEGGQTSEGDNGTDPPAESKEPDVLFPNIEVYRMPPT